MGVSWPTSEQIISVLSEPSTQAAPQSTDITGGSILYCRNGYKLHHGGEGHSMYLGSSGCGKSRRGTIPLTLSFIPAGEAYIAVDPKGELYQATASYAKKAGYDVIAIDFRNIFESARCNLLSMAYKLYKSGDPAKKQYAMELVDDLAHTRYSVRGKADPFWVESARSLFIGCVLLLFESAQPEQVNMASVYHLIAKGETRYAGKNYLTSFVNDLPSDSVASMLLQSYITTANDTRAGIRSVFLEGISLFARSDGLVEMLSGDDLHINQLTGDEKVAIYVILPDETPIYNNIAGILISQLMSHYIRLAENRYHGRLPLRHNFVIEELGNIGHAIPNLSHILSAGRSRNVRVQYVLQSLSQLSNIYGSADAQTIIANTDVVIAYRTNDWETLTELSRKCGEREITRDGHTHRVPLITPTQLSAFKTGQALVSVTGSLRFITWLPDYEEMFDCSDWEPPVRQVRPRDSKPCIFDIVEYTNAKRKKTQDEEDDDFLHKEPSPFYEPPSRPRAPRMPSFEEFMARMDRRIAELDEEGKKEAEKADPPKDETKAVSGYEVLLISHRGNRYSVAKAVSTVCRISISDAMRKLSALPAKFPFQTKEEANTLEQAISEAGGIAIIQERTTPTEDP